MIRIDCQGLSGSDLSDTEQVKGAYDCLVKNGYAILDHVVPVETIASLLVEFYERYPRYLAEERAEDTLEVGDRRSLVPIQFAGRFADPLIYANPAVVAVARLALSETAILETYGAVVSSPGADKQHIHRDAPLLFDSAIAPMLPAHALNFALPLVEMNELHGSTTLWPGSHRWPKRNDEAASQTPVIPVGSCILWDYRLFHSGTANRSTRHRPFVYATYARRWYQDPVNFEEGERRRLTFADGFLSSVPETLRKLFSHVGQAP
ncbi:phytanoyl-CoA dioxygenase family protein [soil metagenome]